MNAMLVIVKVAVPVLLRVKLSGELLVSVGWLTKVKLAGERQAIGVAPVPVKLTVCGLPEVALSAILIEAERLPLAAGVNVTLIAQLPFAATEVPQVLVWAKSPALVPVTDMLVRVKLALPVLVRVTDCEVLATPTDWLPKVRLVGERLTPDAVPVPVRVTDCGLPVALSVILIEAERLPLAAGVNVTLIAQLPFAASEVPQALICAKSPLFVPVTDMLVRVKLALPVLVKVTDCEALATPTGWFPKATLDGERLTLALAPVPVKPTLCTLAATLLLLSVMFKEAARLPIEVGANVTLMVQLPPAASELPQVVVLPKSPALAPARAMLLRVRAAFPVLFSVTVWAALVVPRF